MVKRERIITSMSVLKPTYRFNRITDIPLEFFLGNGIKGLLLDVDNTLTTHDNPQPLEGAMEWLLLMRKSGIKMIIVSNNTAQRVEPFAKMLGLDYIAKGNKPLTSGIQRAANMLKLEKDDIAMIGDQLFTDIMGGNRWGCMTILVDLIEAEHTVFFKFKRFLERKILD